MKNRSLFNRCALIWLPLLLLSGLCVQSATAQSNAAAPQNTEAAPQKISPPEATQSTAGDQGKKTTVPDQKTDRPDKNTSKTEYSQEAFYGAMVVLGVLAFLFWLQLKWSNRLEQAGYLGQLFRDNLEEIEFKRLSSEIVKRFNEGQFHNDVRRDPAFLRAHPQPPGYSATYYDNRRPGGRTPVPGLGGSGLPYSSANPANENSGENSTPYRPTKLEIEAALEAERKAEAKQWAESLEWDAEVNCEATKRYDSALVEPRARAKQLAEKGINIELAALRGRGPEFVLGFTTIVAIVFAAAALGMLGQLDSQQIGTLFAAIAGYVLGRATTRGGAPPEPPRDAAPKLNVMVGREAAVPAQEEDAGKTTRAPKAKSEKEAEKELVSV